MYGFESIEEYDEVTALQGCGFVVADEDFYAEDVMPVVGWLKKYRSNSGNFELIPLASVGNGEVYAINTWDFQEYRYFRTLEDVDRWSRSEIVKQEEQAAMA